MIPKQLINQRFIRVDDNKRPIEDNWQLYNNYSYTDIAFNKYLSENNRYGVLCGVNNLVVVDFDDSEVESECIKQFPDTFTVRTARKGLKHLYFFSDNPESWKVLDKDKNTLVDIQGRSKQVIGANTILLDGRKYEVVSDIPIAKISNELLHKVLDRFNYVKIRESLNLVVTESNNSVLSNIKSQYKISDCLRDYGISSSKNPTMCPLHSSKGGKCFGFDDSRGVWHCFHCEEKGDVISLYQKINGLDFISAKKNLCEKFSIIDNTNSHRLKQLSNKIHKDLKSTFDMTEQVRKFIELNPVYFDSNSLWWLWDSSKCIWFQVDETDLLVLLFGFDHDIPELNKVNRQKEFISNLKILSRSVKPLDPPLNWIQFGNTIHDISTHKDFLATPEYFFTNSLPFAPSDDSTTPMLDKLFIEWVGLETVDLLYQILAYCCYRDYPIHHLFCFIGGGSNGKSTFLQIVSKFIGCENSTSVSLDSLMNSRFEVACLYKKLVCMMGETNFSTISRTETLKKLTGQDPVNFEFKNKNPFTDRNYAKILVSTNTLPETTDKTDGFYRRWVNIDFPNKFIGDTDVLQYIPEYEYNNLSRKIIDLLPLLLNMRKFKNVGSVDDRRAKYESKSNPLPEFISKYCDSDVEGTIFKYDFRDRYNDFLKQNNLRQRSDTEIGTKMKEIGFDDRRIASEDDDKRYMAWINIKWKEVKVPKTTEEKVN